MLESLSPALLGLVVAVVAVAGLVNGIAGFGFALLGTMALATVLAPAEAVVLLIVPLVTVNAALLDELDGGEFRACGRRFFPFVAAALVGTIAGMALLDALPERPLLLALGLVTLAFVATRADRITVPGLESARDRCFVETTPAMVGVGSVSGLAFGATNVGVQVVAYVRSCDLPQRAFVGVLAMIFLGSNALRVFAAALFGLYPSIEFAGFSAALALPAVAGVALGKRVRPHLPESAVERAILVLLTVVGVRLVAGGLGIA